MYPDVQFAGRVPDPELAKILSRALALVVPNVEEFGMAAVECQAAGRPVLGVNKGGIRETVIDGETGILVAEEEVDALAEAMREVDFTRFEPSRIAEHATGFSSAVFRERFQAEVGRRIATRVTGRHLPELRSAR